MQPIIRNNDFIKRRIIIISIAIIIALIHLLRIGSYLQGDLHKLYYSYFSDIMLPFVFYFLLCAVEIKMPLMKSWKVKLAISILLPSIAETLQLFGIPFLGSTFDIFDYLMYWIGSISASIIEVRLFPRIFKFWRIENNTF